MQEESGIDGDGGGSDSGAAIRPPKRRRVVSIRGRGARGACAEERAELRPARSLWSAEEHIELLTASAQCRSLRHMPQAEKSWKTIFERKNGPMQSNPPPSYDLLRRGRIRLDLTVVLAWRQFFNILVSSGASWSVYVWMDASPQWRGRELFAASFDLCWVADGVRHCWRRLFP